jgi:hypothetical protein
MDSVMQALLQHGVLGIMCVLLIGWIYNMDRQNRLDRATDATAAKVERDAADQRQKSLQSELAVEQRARVEDAQRFTGLALQLQGQAVEACGALKSHLGEYKRQADLVEQLVKLMRDEYGRG